MKKTILTIILNLTFVPLFAQDVNDQLLRKLIEKEILTEQEALDIEREAAQEQASNKISENDIIKLKDIVSTRFLKPGGYALFNYTYDNTKNIKHDFAVRAVYLSLKGEPVKNISYFILLSLRNPSLTEFRADWNPTKEFNFRIGQQKIPISIENQLSLAALEQIQSSRIVDYLVGGPNDVQSKQGGNVSLGRDIGIKMYGELFNINGRSLIDYEVGLYQGSGINRSAYRNDKDFAGNILFSPFQGFRFGGGVSIGEAVYSMDNGATVSEHVRNRWVLSSDYRTNRFYARTEWIKANDGGIDKEGLYVLGTWFFVPKKWMLLAKVDYYNDNKDIACEVFDYLAGINYHITKTWRIQGNYTYSDYSKEWNRKNSHMGEIQFQVVF